TRHDRSARRAARQLFPLPWRQGRFPARSSPRGGGARGLQSRHRARQFSGRGRPHPRAPGQAAGKRPRQIMFARLPSATRANGPGGTIEAAAASGDCAMTTIIETKPDGDRDVVLSRIIDAPREQVYAAYTTPSKVSQWWAPRPWKASVVAM